MRMAEMGMGVEGERVIVVVVRVIRMIVMRGGITIIIIIRWALWKFIAWVGFVEVTRLNLVSG